MNFVLNLLLFYHNFCSKSHACAYVDVYNVAQFSGFLCFVFYFALNVSLVFTIDMSIYFRGEKNLLKHEHRPKHKHNTTSMGFDILLCLHEPLSESFFLLYWLR